MIFDIGQFSFVLGRALWRESPQLCQKTNKKMKQSTTLGHSNFLINRIGLGCMGMSEFYGSFDEKESINTLHKALDLGVNFFDTADMYGWGGQ